MSGLIINKPQCVQKFYWCYDVWHIHQVWHNLQVCAQHFSAYQYKMSIMSQSSLKVATLRSLIDGGGGCGTVGGWKKYQKLIIGGGGGGK